ncbi:MAG: DUF3298 and DUF4163 domain-containing protein [Treponema sp.]|jgi:hypothetical protein|nr:DUF3298 and DUF4163 domain-containing protein [Treponema sp.]
MKILYLLQVILLASCQSVSKNAEKPQESSTFNQTVLLFPEKGAESQKLTISMSFPSIPGGRTIEDSVNAVLYEGDAPQAYADKIYSSYKELYESIKAIAENSETANWYYTEEIRVLTGQDAETPVGTVKTPLLQIKRTIEEYTGGAHPIHNTQFYVFDAQSGRRLSIEDFVQDAEALIQTVEASLCRDKGVAPGTPLDEAEITFLGKEHLDSLPDNFFLTDQGVGFYWNEYEIAPYSTGGIKTVVLYDDIHLSN